MTDFHDQVLKVVGGLIEEKVRSDGEGYANAFYDLAKLLDIEPQAKSPKEVWETQMLPQVKTLLDLSPVVHIAGWLNEDELPGSYPYDEMFQHSEVHGVRLFPIFVPGSLKTAGDSTEVGLKEALGLLREASQFIARYTDGRGTEVLRDKIETFIFKSINSPAVTRGNGE